MEIGLDLHKRKSQLAIKAEDGTITDRRIVTSRERFTAVFGGRPRALRLQRPVHPLMPPSLARRGALDQVGQDPELHLPYREHGEAPERLGGEGHAIIAADPDREAVLFEGAEKHRPAPRDRRAGEGAAAQEKPAAPIRHRQGIAAAPVPETELAFEVNGPDGL